MLKYLYNFRSDYGSIFSKNAIRQLYSEYRIGKFLEKNKSKYKLAVVCGPDYFIVNDINLNDVKKSLSIERCIYTSDQNDGSGYTNGFYFGKPNILEIILKRYEYFHTFSYNRDYEYLLKQAFIVNKINRRVTDMVFFKIRTNKYVIWQVRKESISYQNKDYWDILKQTREKLKSSS